MGGFVYFRSPADSGPVNSVHGYDAALAAMRAKGLKHKHRIFRDDFELHLFDKMRLESFNYREFDAGDFIAATGTLIYKKAMGAAALDNLFRDFREDRLEFQNAIGHFAVWIYTGSDLYVFNDYQGIYQVYQNGDQSVMSSAFVAVLETLKSRTPDRQRVFEYLTYGTTFGSGSVLKEIDLLDKKNISCPLIRDTSCPKKIKLSEFDGTMSFDGQVNLITTYLDDYFATIYKLFGDYQSIGLSGGYDSRLTLAHMRKSGARPYVYVQGAAESPDVRVARAIAAGERFDIAYSENEAKSEFPEDDLLARIQTAYFYLDALPHMGLFNDYALVSDERRKADRPEKIRLYGMGGEIFRRTRHLSDRDHTLDEYLKIQSDNFEHSMYTSVFDKRTFLNNIGDEVRLALEIEGNLMTRAQTELAYPHFALPRYSGPQLSAQNERAFALIPYSEPIFTVASQEIPIGYRYLGRFEAALIKAADTALAGYPCEHGYNFIDGPGLKARVRERIKTAVPMSIRPLLRRQKSRLKRAPQRPFYLADEYVRTVLPEDGARIAEFVDVSGVTDYSLESRALSLELVLSGHVGAA